METTSHNCVHVLHVSIQGGNIQRLICSHLNLACHTWFNWHHCGAGYASKGHCCVQCVLLTAMIFGCSYTGAQALKLCMVSGMYWSHVSWVCMYVWVWIASHFINELHHMIPLTVLKVQSWWWGWWGRTKAVSHGNSYWNLFSIFQIIEPLYHIHQCNFATL